MEDLNKVVKSIDFLSKQGTKGKNYFCKLTLINDSSTEMYIDKELAQAIIYLKNQNNGQAFKRKELVKEVSEKTGKEYCCVLVELVDGSIFRFFPKFAFNIIINGLLSKNENKKQG